MSAAATEELYRDNRADALALAPAPTRKWDPVAFRMEPGTQRSETERTAEAASWSHNLAGGRAGGSLAKDEPLPPPAQWGAALARTAVEVLLGVRPPQQLVRWLDEPVYRALSRRASLTARTVGLVKRPAVVKSAHATRLNEHTAEVAVVLQDGSRHRAAALRLECYHGRWLATALEIG